MDERKQELQEDESIPIHRSAFTVLTLTSTACEGYGRLHKRRPLDELAPVTQTDHCSADRPTDRLNAQERKGVLRSLALSLLFPVTPPQAPSSAHPRSFACLRADPLRSVCTYMGALVCMRMNE
mmetsp:Transcript_4386/g.8851  ORF Transcript_4386/g.8851 Transcript_4386/m.8851 type:complete len:124 (-) Transcript_4386:11-382(-)